ncbi:MAG: hypothetical protein LBQ95_08720 [Lachnospiraceae bacterium]|jgi:hypothetical protein|nr:hypothetical protein [Lachnospiraceae bacterium]
MANVQTKATKKWREKVGIISKSYGLKKDLAEAFAAACEKAGVSQASQISKMMKEFIEQSEKG